MTSSGAQMYQPVQQVPPGVQQQQQQPPPQPQPQQQQQPQQQPQHVQYQPPPPYNSNPYSPGANLYANSLISAYGQLPPPPPPIPPQQYTYEQPTVGAKRSSDDASQSVDLLSKRPRPDSGGSVAFYPQRPGERLCAFYMTTRTCSFGVTCKFDHPSWVPYGGIPNWKEVSGTSINALPTTDPANLPQRAGEQNCAFYMKTGECKYGVRCRFNHPKERQAAVSDSTFQNKDEAVPSFQNGAMAGSDAAVTTGAAPTSSISSGAISGTHSVPVKVPTIGEKAPNKASPLNSKGLPLRQSETDCTYYIKTGSCKFGGSCRFNHPEVIRPGARPVLPPIPAQSLPVTTVSTTPYNNADMYVHDGTVAPNPLPVKVEENGMTMNSLHPQRPGGPDCSYYLKTGECSFGAACKFHHPHNRQPTQPSLPKAVPKLTLAGLPRREGETICAYYMKTGACKYGSTCRFDHPPPGEIAAKAAAEATRTEVPPMLEAYDVHHPPGVPMQYVDLNPPSPSITPAPPVVTNGVGNTKKQEGITIKQVGSTA